MNGSVEQATFGCRLRRALAAWGLIVLSALIGVVLVQAPAVAKDGKPRPVKLPPSVQGEPTVTGPATVDPPGPRGPILTGIELIMTGVGAYEGTCYVLGVLFDAPDGCDEGQVTILSGLGFGPSGDDRGTFFPGDPTVELYAPGRNNCATSNPKPCAALFWGWGYPGAPAERSGRLRDKGVTTVRSGYTCANGTRKTLNYTAVVSSTSSQVTANLDGGFSSVDPSYVGWCAAAPYDVGPAMMVGAVKHVWWQKGVCGGAACTAGAAESSVTWTDMDTWTMDPPQAWYLDYTRQCWSTVTRSSFNVERSIAFNPNAGQELPMPDLPTCQSVEPGSIQTGLGIEGGRQSVSSPEVEITFPSFAPGKTAQYPLCTTGGPARGCWLDLQRAGKSCFDDGVYCAAWQENITRWNMSCEWGPYQVPIAECVEAYGTKFDTQVQPTTPTTPGTGTNPTTPGTLPGTQTDPDSTGCFGDTFSLNPVDWVYVPVKCSLLWAFKPQTSLSTRVSTVQAAFATAPPFAWFAQLGAIPTAVPNQGCPDWEIKVGGMTKNVVCDSSYIDAIRAGRPVFAAMMIATAFAPFLRSLAYASVPILSPVPH